MKIGNFSFVPNSNANKYNTKQAMPQPKIDSPPTSYQQRGKELAAAVLGDKMAKELGLPVAETKKDKPLFDFNVVDVVGRPGSQVRPKSLLFVVVL